MGSRGYGVEGHGWGRGHEDIHTFHGDMGFRGHGDMGFRGHGTEDIHTFRVRHGDMGTWGLGDMVQKTCKPLGLDMGTWGVGDMGFRGHGTEDIHTG